MGIKNFLRKGFEDFERKNEARQKKSQDLQRKIKNAQEGAFEKQLIKSAKARGRAKAKAQLPTKVHFGPSVLRGSVVGERPSVQRKVVKKIIKRNKRRRKGDKGRIRSALKDQTPKRSEFDKIFWET